MGFRKNWGLFRHGNWLSCKCSISSLPRTPPGTDLFPAPWGLAPEGRKEELRKDSSKFFSCEKSEKTQPPASYLTTSPQLNFIQPWLTLAGKGDPVHIRMIIRDFFLFEFKYTFFLLVFFDVIQGLLRKKASQIRGQTSDRREEGSTSILNYLFNFSKPEEEILLRHYPKRKPRKQGYGIARPRRTSLIPKIRRRPDPRVLRLNV